MSDEKSSRPDDSAQVPDFRCVRNPQADEHPNWYPIAHSAIVRFAKRHPGRRFLTEEFRHSLSVDFPLPVEPRRWGAIMRAAKEAGLIRRVGYRNAHSSNLSPKPEWEALS